MKLKLIPSLMVAAASAVSVTAQEITPIWYEHVNALYNVAPENKLPVLVKTPTGGTEAADGSSTFESYAKFLKYDDDHYLLGVRENGINENATDLTEEQKALAAAYPDRSIVWIDAKTAKPLGIAFKMPILPVVNAAQNSPDFFWKWSVDEGAYGEKVIYSGFRYKVLRWAPTGTVTDPNFPKGRPTWSDTPTEAWVEPIPEEPNPTIAPGERGTEPGASGGGTHNSWRLKAFRVTGAGPTTKLWAGGATWRHSMHEQEFVTDDAGLTFRPIARLNDRGDGGGAKGFFSLGGQPGSIRSDVGDTNRPNLEWTIQGHYPGAGWQNRPNRYVKNPDAFVIDQDGNQVENVRSNRFDATWGADTDAWKSRENEPIGRLPAFAWESAGTAGICGPDNAIDGVTRYDGNWSLTTDSKDGLDYIVSYSMPSWDNQFEPIKKPAWLGIHTLDGKIAPGKSSLKLDFVENDEDDTNDNGPGRGTDWIYDGDVEVYVDKDAPAGTQRSTVLWVGGGSGFGVFSVQNVAATGTVTSPVDAVTEANHSVTLRGQFVGSGTPILFQWQKDDGTGKFVDVKNGSGNLARFGNLGSDITYTLNLPKVSDSGKYRFTVGNAAGKLTSGVATLTVNADVTAPKVVSAGSVDGTSVDINFDELLDAGGADITADPGTARAVANYKLSGGAVATEAVLRNNGKSVRLNGVTGLTSPFTVTVTGVGDLTRGNAIAAPGASATGTILGWNTVDINVAADDVVGSSFSADGSTIEVEAGGNDLWDSADSFHFTYKERSGDFDVKVQISANTRPSNRNGIMARESLDQDSVNVFQGWNPDSGYISSARAETGKKPDWFSTAKNWIPNACSFDKAPSGAPAVWLRLKRTGSTFTGYRSVDGVTWTMDGSFESSLPDNIYLGLATDRGGAKGPYARTTYSNFSDVSSLNVSSTGGSYVLSWSGSGKLESAPTVLGPWTVVTDQSNPQNLSPANFSVSLSAAQDGGGSRTGSGAGTLTLSGNTLSFNGITFSGVSGDVQAAHIHGPAAAGSNASVLYDLVPTFVVTGGRSGTISGSLTLVDKSPAGPTIDKQLEQLKSGLWYINVHTTTFGGGEIRGQLTPGGAQFYRLR